MTTQPDENTPAYENPAGHVITCPFCGRLAHGVTEGRWTHDGTAYVQIVYRCDDCPVIDPQLRSQRPAIHISDGPYVGGGASYAIAPRRSLKEVVGDVLWAALHPFRKAKP